MILPWLFLGAVVASVACQNPVQKFQDNVSDLMDASLYKLILQYKKIDGKIPLPDIMGASKGSIRGLYLLQRHPVVWGVSEPVHFNPRRVDYRFKLVLARAKYLEFTPTIFLASRILEYDIGNIEFSAKARVEISERSCSLHLEGLDVADMGEATRPKVSGGLLSILNDILGTFMNASLREIVEVIREDMEARLRAVIEYGNDNGNGGFNCESYYPSRIFQQSQNKV